MRFGLHAAKAERNESYRNSLALHRNPSSICLICPTSADGGQRSPPEFYTRRRMTKAPYLPARVSCLGPESRLVLRGVSDRAAS